MKRKDYEKQKAENKETKPMSHAEEYIEELKSGKRRNDYAYGDPNCRNFEIDYMSPENQRREHEHIMESLEEVGQIVDEMRAEQEAREKEKPKGLQERKEKILRGETITSPSYEDDFFTIPRGCKKHIDLTKIK